MRKLGSVILWIFHSMRKPALKAQNTKLSTMPFIIPEGEMS